MKGKKNLCSIVFLCFSTLIIWTPASVSAEEVLLVLKPLLGVYLVKGDTEERIIYRQGPHVAPRLSPDGEQILFHSKCAKPSRESGQGGKIGIWLTNLHGEEMERLCDGDQANWSFDGERIIFRRGGRIIEREIASGRERIITPEERFSCEFPSYLPDGRVIFVRNEKIFLIDLDKKTLAGQSHAATPLVEGEIRSAPKCSPDGRRIAYQDGAHIYLMDLGERRISQLTTAGGVQSWPMWSQDSRSICYCQSPAFGGPWDIYNVEINSPHNVGLVMRKVDISPDWRGSFPPTSTTVELKGHRINLWRIGKSLDEKESWKTLPVDNDYGVEGEIAVENDWGIFYLSMKKNKFLVFPKDGKEIELTAINKEGNPATEIKSIYVSNNDGENVVLKVCLRSEEGDVMEAIFTVPRSRPFVKIKPVENIDKVYVKRDLDLALLPDRFADVLIIAPQKYSTSRILLPHTPFLIGLTDERDMFLVITPSDKQEIWLIKGEEDYFEGVEVLTGEESVFISLSPGRNLWYQTEVVPNPDTDGWKIKWSNPFLAQWRVAMLGNGKYYSRMWDEEALNKLKEPSLPIEREFSEPPELSIIYLYGRSWNTPLDVVTPMDILQDTLGVEKLRSVLDIDGIRTYRTAEQPVPLHEFLTSHENRLWPEDSPGWPQVLDFSPIFQLLVRINMVERKGVEATVTHLCEDILNLLKGLDNRIEEYETFLVNLENLCVEHVASLSKIEKSIENLRGTLAHLSITEIGKVSDSIEAVRGCLGTGEELWDRDEFYRFRKISESALSERQEILTKYRDFVKRVRNRVGIMITEEPETKELSEEIRRLTQNVLRKRYYLEGDWRGEKPLD